MAEPLVVSALVAKCAELAVDGRPADRPEGGVRTTAPVLRTKASRGGFSAVFMVQCLEAIGCRRVELGDD